MDYYIFNSDTDNNFGRFLPVVDRNGLALGSSFAIENNRYDNIDIAYAHSEFSTKKIPDKLFSIVGDLLLSNRAVDIINRLLICPHVKAKHTIIMSRNSKQIGEYHLLYAKKWYNAIDEVNSEFKYVGNKPIYAKKRLLKRYLIPNYDIFYAEYFKWIVSRRLVDLFMENSLTGCEFVQIEISE